MSAGEYDRYDRIRGVLAEADEPLTAREILVLVEERDESGEGLNSPHRVATVLGRRADRGEVEVISGQPYRYRLET
jgi:predicted Zn-ribbon and HTH transcriptional regulator